MIVLPTRRYITYGQEGCRDVMLKKGYRLREMWYLCRATTSADLGPFECRQDPFQLQANIPHFWSASRSLGQNYHQLLC